MLRRTQRVIADRVRRLIGLTAVPLSLGNAALLSTSLMTITTSGSSHLYTALFMRSQRLVLRPGYFPSRSAFALGVKGARNRSRQIAVLVVAFCRAITEPDAYGLARIVDPGKG